MGIDTYNKYHIYMNCNQPILDLIYTCDTYVSLKSNNECGM